MRAEERDAGRTDRRAAVELAAIRVREAAACAERLRAASARTAQSGSGAAR